jgi:hypothetical protein
MRLILLSTLMLFIGAHAHASEILKVTYGIYASGFNVVDMTGTYTITDDAYDLKMDMETVGMLGSLAPWGGVIHSSGLNKKNQSTPLKHSFASTWRDKIETSTFTFNNDGVLQSYILEEDDGTIKDKMPAPEVHEGNPVDMLTALFRTMHEHTCESIQPALDGKRRFDMAFRSKGTEIREKSRYSIFEGEAEICEVEIIPVAGKWRDKPRGWMSIQGQAKENGQLPRLWFGKVRDDMPAIPVRFQIKTNYGTMLMHLKDIE